MLHRMAKGILAAFIIVLGALSPGICVALKNISLEAEPIAAKYGGRLPWFMRWFADIPEAIFNFIWMLIAGIIIAVALIEAVSESRRDREDQKKSFPLKSSTFISLSCLLLFLVIFVLYFLHAVFYEYTILNVIVATK